MMQNHPSTAASSVQYDTGSIIPHRWVTMADTSPALRVAEPPSPPHHCGVAGAPAVGRRTTTTEMSSVDPLACAALTSEAAMSLRGESSLQE